MRKVLSMRGDQTTQRSIGANSFLSLYQALLTSAARPDAYGGTPNTLRHLAAIDRAGIKRKAVSFTAQLLCVRQRRLHEVKDLPFATSPCAQRRARERQVVGTGKLASNVSVAAKCVSSIQQKYALWAQTVKDRLPMHASIWGPALTICHLRTPFSS